MKIDDITLTRSAVVPNNFVLTIESGGYKATLHFENHLQHLAAAVGDALKFFGQAHGLITISKEGKIRKAGS